MPVAAHALVDVDELKEHFCLATGTQKDGKLEDLAHAVTEHVEAHLGRLLISRGSITEFHSVRCGASELKPLQWPLLTITSVAESTDSPRDYTGDNVLVLDTDYQRVERPRVRSKLRRVENDEPIAWAYGTRAIKLVYTAGYASRAALDPGIRSLALRYAAKLWREAELLQPPGGDSVSDSVGSISFGPPRFDDQMRQELEGYRRLDWEETGELAS